MVNVLTVQSPVLWSGQLSQRARFFAGWNYFEGVGCDNWANVTSVTNVCYDLLRYYAPRAVVAAHEVRGVNDANNDKKARFSGLILPFLADAQTLARFLTGNSADAEDVVQEACLRAYRAIDSVIESSARAWFLTITHHTGCSWLRKNRPAALTLVDDLESVEIAPNRPSEQDSETPETALMAKSDRACLEAALAALPLAYRETIILREIEGLNYREIAQVTGVPVGTVMSRLARARERLGAITRNLQ